MKKKYIVNRKSVWLTFVAVKGEQFGEIKEFHDQFYCYYNMSQPTNEYIGEAFVNTDSYKMIFRSIEDAESYAIEKLQKIIYPPDILPIAGYTANNISELMYKDAKIEINTFDSNFATKIITGQITTYLFAGKPTFLPARVVVKNHEKSEIMVSFQEIRKIEFIKNNIA